LATVAIAKPKNSCDPVCRGAGHVAICSAHGTSQNRNPGKSARIARLSFHRAPPGGFHNSGAAAIPFQRADCVFQRARFQTQASGPRLGCPGLKWVVIDMLSVTLVDATGLYTAQEVVAEVSPRGATLTVAGRQAEWRAWSESRLLPEGFHRPTIFRLKGLL